MPKTSKESRLFSNKSKTKIKPDLKIAKSSLRQTLQTFRNILLAGNGFIPYKQF